MITTDVRNTYLSYLRVVCFIPLSMAAKKKKVTECEGSMNWSRGVRAGVVLLPKLASLTLS